MFYQIEFYIAFVSLGIIFTTPYFFKLKSPTSIEKTYIFKLFYLLAYGLTLGLQPYDIGSHRRYKAIVGAAMYVFVLSIISILANN